MEWIQKERDEQTTIGFLPSRWGPNHFQMGLQYA